MKTIRIMDAIEIIGLTAALMTTISNIPQAYKIIKTKETKAVSLWSNLLLLCGLVVWVIYGLQRDDWPVIIANAISALITATVVLLKIVSKKTLANLHEKASA